MNTWNELVLKPEHLQPTGQQMVYAPVTDHNDNSNSSMLNLISQTGGYPPQQQQQQQNAAVAAAVATAMMMSHQQGSNNSLNNLNNSSHDLENGENDDSMDNSDDDCNSSVNDAEGVWSPDIEQSFQEALAIYPPCGRRKIILSEEGKMYGRNELIARYIKVRTGKTRSRKQVSSHIQVLAKRKTKDFHNHLKDTKDTKFTNGVFQNPFSNLTSAQIISPQPLVQLQSQQNLVVPNPANTAKPTNTTPVAPGSNPRQNSQVLQQPPAQNRPLPPNQQSQLHPQLLQNCTNLLGGGAVNSSSIWSHPGIQLEKGGLVAGSSSSLTNPDELLQGANNSNTNNENIRHHHVHHIPHHAQHHQQQQQQQQQQHHHNHNHQSNQQLSPDSSPNSNPQLWSLYNNNNNSAQSTNLNNIYNKSVIGLHQLRLIEFSGFLEKRRDPEIYHKHLFLHLNTSDYFTGANAENEEFENINYKEFADKFPENDLMWSIQSQEKPMCASYLIKYWVDLNYILEDGVSALYAVTNIFESTEPMTISCSTKVCSFGNQVVEKVDNVNAQYEAGRYVYRIENSPMCEYMVKFINKLKQLPEKSLKNSVLENFSVLQIVKNHDTKETLLTLAYVFEVSTSEHGAQHVIFRLTNN